MTLLELLENANLATDEDLEFEEGYRFINEAISAINVEMDSNYPVYKVTDQNKEIPFPVKWQLALIVPFVSARIKQVDSSQFEFTQFFDEFYANLSQFKMKFVVPEEYRDAESNVSIPPDFSKNTFAGGW